MPRPVMKASRLPVVARRCVDCPAAGKPRPAPHPGPRCATHHRAAVKARKARAAELAAARRYGVGPGDYERQLAAQGGVCAGCGPRTGRNGRTKRLAWDHNHTTGEVRGLLCSTCNRTVGAFRDDAETFQRLADYLRNPPARAVLGHTGAVDGTTQTR